MLFIDEDTGVVTMAIDSVNPNILYAAAYQRRRAPWGFRGGGPGSGLYKTTDGGDSWRRLMAGLPEGPIGRIGVAVYRSDPRIVYALVEHGEDGGLYRSTDRGERWEHVNGLNPRPMYYSKIVVDLNDADRVYVLGSSFHVSDDGGRSFAENLDMTPTYDIGVHGDHHALWIDPTNSAHLVLGGDGGLYFSWDRSTNWDKVNNIPIAQFYAIAVDMETPYNVYGGTQDTHSWAGPSATRTQIGILNSDWFQTNFGDGMYQQPDPIDRWTIYTESQGGNLVRLDRRTGDQKVIKPYPDDEETRYRFHWTTPILVSRHDAKTVFFGGNRLFVSRNRGETWRASRDLTRNEDRDEREIMGAVVDGTTLSANDGVSDSGTITTIGESPLVARTLLLGTDDGRLQLSRDDGESFQSLEERIPDFDPRRAKVSRAAPSSHRRERAYVSYDRHELGDFAPYIFVTDDMGGSFRPIAGGLPARGWVNVVVEHPDNPDLLFAGTGLFVTFDAGLAWSRMNFGLPTVPIDDLAIHLRDGDLVVGTHGRSIYILDDASALAAYRPNGPDVQLFAPRPATMFLPWKHESYGAQRQFVGKNPPFGALITYHLARGSTGDAKLVVRDRSGDSIREIEAGGAPGFQRVVWDLRTESPDGVPRGRGPLVPPGHYAVELVASFGSVKTSVDVVLDPRLELEAGELEDRYTFLKRVNALRSRIERTVARTASLGEDVDALRELLPDEALRDRLAELA